MLKNRSIRTHGAFLQGDSRRSPGLAIFIVSISLLLFVSCGTQPGTKETNAAAVSPASSERPKVTQIDEAGLREILKPKGKPVLINFWATWCAPCREEFPDLVKIGGRYKDKVEVITVSLDDVSEIEAEVPRFLAQMKYASPAYLLKTPDESAAIGLVSKDWQGALPFTILIDAGGNAVYSKQGKFKPDVLAAEIGEL